MDLLRIEEDVMKSIQTKFMFLILSSAIVCALVIGGGAIHSTTRVIDDFSESFMNAQCREAAEKFNSKLARIEQSVDTLSTFVIDQLESVNKLKTDENYVEEYTNNLEPTTLNIANHTDGVLAVYVRFNPEFTKPDSGLFWSKSSTNGIFQKNVPTDISNYSPEDIEHVGWYYLPIENKKAMWLEPYMNKNINVLMISYVMPLYKGNEVIGVVGMDIDFRIFEKLSNNIRVYDTGFSFLSSEDGRIIHHPTYALHTNMVDINAEFLPLVQELKRNTSVEHLFSYTLNGENKKMAYTTLENGMKLAITAPTQEINKERNHLVIQSGILLFIITILFVCITYAVTKRLIKPLRELNEAAKKIAEGDLTITLSQQSKDEVGMLTSSFQLMVDQLQKYISYINGLAYRDALTGVKNKMAYQERCNQLEKEMQTGHPEFAIVMFDINNLKIVNDTLGHAIGDMLIVDACRLICKIFQHSPVYRIGGDEFVVILEQSDYENRDRLLKDFEVNMREHNETAWKESDFSIAWGMAVYDINMDFVYECVFKRADDAMYQSKAYEKKLIKRNDLKKGES